MLVEYLVTHADRSCGVSPAQRQHDGGSSPCAHETPSRPCPAPVLGAAWQRSCSGQLRASRALSPHEEARAHESSAGTSESSRDRAPSRAAETRTSAGRARTAREEVPPRRDVPPHVRVRVRVPVRLALTSGRSLCTDPLPPSPPDTRHLARTHALQATARSVGANCPGVPFLTAAAGESECGFSVFTDACSRVRRSACWLGRGWRVR